MGELISKELNWKDTQGRYFDDLYHGFMSKVLREKFNIDLRKTSFSALIRSNQMSKNDALAELQKIQDSEDPKIINLAIERLGITKKYLDEWLALPPKTFLSYKTDYNYITKFRIPILIMSRMNLLPSIAYDKYFYT